LINNLSFPRPVFGGLILLVVLITGLMTGGEKPQQPVVAESIPHVPSYFVRDLSMTSMGSDGLPERHVKSSYVVQYLDDETTEMQAPNYNFFRAGQPPWRVTAEQGWLSADGELALLSGRVTILRPAGENSAPFKLITSNLRIQPENNYLETDDPVKANSGSDQIDAVGMQAWMGKPARIKFLSDVRANYVPR